MKKKWVRRICSTLLAGSMAASLLTGCGSGNGEKSEGSASSSSAQEKQELTIGVTSFADTLEPTEQYFSWVVSRYGIGETLVKFDGLLGPSMVNAVLAISAVSWTKYARLARSMVLKIKKNLYIEAAVVTGTRNHKIILNYILPNMITTMVVTAATDIGTMMLELASLSFLGFGAQAPVPEWGLMLNEGRTYLTKAPWLMLYPGIAIVIVVVVFNMLGDSIRDILDPRQEKKRRA